MEGGGEEGGRGEGGDEKLECWMLIIDLTEGECCGERASACDSRNTRTHLPENGPEKRSWKMMVKTCGDFCPKELGGVFYFGCDNFFSAIFA